MGKPGEEAAEGQSDRQEEQQVQNAIKSSIAAEWIASTVGTGETVEVDAGQIIK